MRSKIYLVLLIILPLFASAQDGKELFKSKCKACHNIDKKLVGPPLDEATAKYDMEWIYNFVNGSQAMVEAGDPQAVKVYQEYNSILMPDQGRTHEEIDAIFAYIDSQGAAAAGDNPIKRPDVGPQVQYRNIRFDNYGFWIPFTIMGCLLVLGLYYMTVSYDIMHNRDNLGAELSAFSKKLRIILEKMVELPRVELGSSK